MNRRLIRPSLNEMKEQMANRQPPRKKPTPPETTNAENFYYVKQMQTRTPMIVVLQDGEQVHGVIEWYDKYCIKVHRSNEPNLLIYKSNIKYLYKASEARGGGGSPQPAPTAAPGSDHE
jgi:RNA chaperone Hfq